MKDMYILGIESSCDETSASIVKNGTEEIATVISSQIDVHKDFGGEVPEIASRHHVKNVTMVLEECLDKANMTMDEVRRCYKKVLYSVDMIAIEMKTTNRFDVDDRFILEAFRSIPNNNPDNKR